MRKENKSVMIKITEMSKRKYKIERNNKLITNLDLIFSPVTNKFNKITEFVEDCSKQLGEEFDDFFESLIMEYKDSSGSTDIKVENKKPGYDAAILISKIPELKKFADKYLELQNVDFSNYVNLDKKSKNSIFFDAEEIENMIKASNYLKLYFVICQDTDLKPPAQYHKEIYSNLVEKIQTCSVVAKLFKLVSSKTYRYNLSDKTMWDFLKVVHCTTTDMHVSAIFNFLMNNILVTCETTSNPIPYFSSVIDESIRWILNGVYKDSVIYSDTINTEDIHTISGKDNLLSYCYNDTIGKLVADSTNFLEAVGIQDIGKFNNLVSKLKEPSLLANYITFPLLQKCFDIPYRYFKPIPTEHAYLLNILIYHYLPEDIKEELSTITKLLLYYNEQRPITKTTYKIKETSIFFETFRSFMGFKNQIFPYEFFSQLIGKLARNQYIDFLTGKPIVNFPLIRLESDMTKFYNMYFSGQLDDICYKMAQNMEKHM